MAGDSMALVDTLRKAVSEGDVDVMREESASSPRRPWMPR